MEGQRKFQGEGGIAKAKVFKKKYGANLEFPEGWGGAVCKLKKPSAVMWYAYFLEPHWKFGSSNFQDSGIPLAP